MHNTTVLLIEVGALLLGLSILGRLAIRIRVSPIPLYLLAGLVFGKGGYVNEAQRKLVVADDGASAYSRGHADGYQYGGGVEFTLHDKFSAVPGGVYVSAQYVRSQFDNHTADNHAMGGIGFRFR